MIHKEVAVTDKERPTTAAFAILTMAEIKAATDGFDDGEANVFEALDAVVVAVEAYRAAAPPRREAA